MIDPIAVDVVAIDRAGTIVMAAATDGSPASPADAHVAPVLHEEDNDRREGRTPRGYGSTCEDVQSWRSRAAE